MYAVVIIGNGYSDPNFFDEDFLGRISDSEVSWPLKKNNLHKIYLRVRDFYKESLSVTLTEKWTMDFRNEAEETIMNSVDCLLRLVLAASVLHVREQKYFINLLMKQSEALQFFAMEIIREMEKLMPHATGEVGRKANDVSSSGTEISEMRAKVEKLSRENQCLQEELKEMKEERDSLAEQNRTLRTDVEDLSGSSSEVESLRKQLRAANTLKTSVQDSLYKAEAERDHFKKSFEEITKEHTLVLDKLQKLAPLEEEYRKAKDELEEFRLRVLDFEKLNSQVETYKSKIKECNAQKVEMKVLKEKVDTYMQSVIALEDEKRKNGVLKIQVESLRLENKDSNEKHRRELLRAEKAEFEIKRLTDRLKDAEDVKNKLRGECKELNEKLFLNGGMGASKASASSLHDETMEASGFSLQERMLRLEKENEKLQAKESEEIKLMKEELSSMAEKKALVESELNWSQRQLMELEAKLKDAEDCITKGKGLSEDRYSEEQAQKEKLSLNVAQLQARLEQANKQFESVVEEKEELKRQLETAGQNLLAEKEKLRIYMEKARTVIDDVEKQNRAVEAGGLSRHEFDAIRHDRDSYKQMFEALKASFERRRTLKEEEQRLIISHYYDLMMQRQHFNHGEDSARSELMSTPEKSFLARQRQCNNFSR
ncbi:unnamed protein product [Enterobius vermicularis]|uniref:HOOK domain-containing protein n=1 Tax=Enterobius vermicularis TaxID=51028 RepID=A0A0N4UX27_ENTVE|nr:unnamed protein product [Enterobius vermicularis]